MLKIYALLLLDHTCLFNYKQYNYRDSKAIQPFRYYITLYLKWQTHINYISKKVSKAIDVMYT